MNTTWPYTGNYTFATNGYPTLEQIREVVREEIRNALPSPIDPRPSATIEYVQDGKKWQGTVYLVEDEESEE